MVLGLEQIRTLFRAGRFVEIVDGFSTVTSLRDAPTELRVLVSHALYHNGRIEPAFDLLTRENQASAPPAIRAHCEQVLGHIGRHQGRAAQARLHYQNAIQLGKDARDQRRVAWASLSLFRAMAEAEPNELLVAMLPELRTQVARAADPQLTGYLHDSIALMEVANGRLREAGRHLRIATSLLETEPNAWLDQMFANSSFVVSFLESEYDEAAKHLARARKLLAVTGDQDRRLIESNEGHLLLLTGQFRKAIELFRRVTSQTDSTRPALAALEALARAYLATNQLDECERTLDHYRREISAGDPTIDSEFVGRWTGVTRIKLLLRQQRATEAVQEATTRLRNALHRDDRLLVAALGCLRAEALATSGESNASVAQLTDSMHCETTTPTPDQCATFYRAASEVLGYSGSIGAQSARARAIRVWAEEGNRCSIAELGPSEHDATTVPPANSAIEILSSIATIFTQCNRDSLVAQELQRLLAACGFGPSATILEAEKSRLKAIRDDRLCVLEVGDGKGAVAVACEKPTNPEQALVLSEVFRIARAARALDTFTRSDRDRAALWPADPIETEAGALFLAEEMQALLTTARRVAPTNVPILITGETGTGKEVLARLIHAYSNRAKAVFLPFNCSAVPKDMLDSQLFGHRRGSFTGAAENFQGVIRAAGNGTLLLDEIGETTLDVQPKLLRFLESGEVHPIGELHPARVDVRVIAATNADVDQLVSEGRFREDLFYRLNIVRLHLPPLRDRRVEIPALANHYLRKHALEFGKGDLRLSEETMEYLVLYRWPGNVRQLANQMRKLAALAETGAVLMPEHLSPDIAASRRTIPASERTLEPTEVVVRLDQPMAAAVQHVEHALILHALKQTGSNMEATAALLGVSRKGLYLKRQRYGIEAPGEANGVAVA